MHRAVAMAALAMGAPLLSGCVAAAIPAIAAGAMVRGDRDDRGQAAQETRASAASPHGGNSAQPPATAPETLAAEAAAAPAREAIELPPPPAGTMTTMAGAPFAGDYDEFLSFAQRQMQRRAEGEALTSVVLVRNFSLDRPEYTACEDRAAAVIVDLDDAVLGAEAAVGTTQTGWQAAPGLPEGLTRLRNADVTILWMTDAPFYRLDEIRSRLRETELDPEGRDPVYAQRGSSDRKQLRRLDAAAAWCIIAAAGDRQADLDEVYDYLIRPEAAVQLDRLWDQGWFITPAPIQAAPPAATP